MASNFDGLYIGGRWVHPGRSFDDLNPANGNVWARVPDGSLQDTRAAIDAAQAAFPAWSALMFQQRSHYMIKIAEVVERRKKDLVEALKHEGGGWFGKGMFEAGYVHLDAGTDEELYLWPYFFAVPLDSLDARQRVELFTLVTAGDYEDMKQLGAYNFYRAGITPDGQWVMFVAGS